MLLVNVFQAIVKAEAELYNVTSALYMECSISFLRVFVVFFFFKLRLTATGLLQNSLVK